MTNNTPSIIEDSVSVYIPEANKEVANLFLHQGYAITTQPHDADIIVFTGGPDICPLLYGERMNTRFTRIQMERDRKDIEILRQARPEQRLVGICRGAQFLNVMVGNGSLWQHVDGHASGMHVLEAVTDWNESDDEPVIQKFKVSSTHHQLMVPGPTAMVLGWARMASNFYGENPNQPAFTQNLTDRMDEGYNGEAETVLYEFPQLALCVQWHPEYRTTETKAVHHFFQLIEEYLLTEEEREIITESFFNVA